MMTERLQLRQVKIRGYRAIEDVDLPLRSLNVIIGPNGVGKSSFLDVFGFFSEALGRREPIGRLLSRRGGIGRLLTLGRRDSVEVEFVTQSIPTARHPESGPLRYEVAIAASGIGYAIAKERLSQARGQVMPFYFVERTEQRTMVFDPSSKGLASLDPPPLGELALAQVPRALSEAEWFRTALGDVHRHDAVPTNADAPIRRPQTLEPTDMIVGPGGGNLFSVLHQIRLEQPDWYERILDVVRSAFPGFNRLEFPAVAAGQVTLAWYQDAYGDKPFYANELSAGTLRFLHLVTLLLTPKSPTLILIDEPEDSLHPELLRLVAELLLEAAERTQLIVATQSPALLQWLKPEHVLVADAVDGACALTSGVDLNLKEWLADYSLDRLWQMGNIGGRP
jgi:predicted ATPase